MVLENFTTQSYLKNYHLQSSSRHTKDKKRLVAQHVSPRLTPREYLLMLSLEQGVPLYTSFEARVTDTLFGASTSSRDVPLYTRQPY